METTQYKIKNNKHIIIGGEAFTEDGVLIYNLFVYDLPKYTTIPEVYEYFKNFGAVLDVRLLGKNNGIKCIVYFAEPNVAAKILKETCHVFMDCVIRVKPSHSLHQPDGQKLLKVLDSLGGISATENVNSCNTLNKIDQKALILNLNDDCLEHICKKLDLTDQISFALSCQRFYGILVMLSKVQNAHLNTRSFRGWTLLQIRIFLAIVGPQIKTLELCYSFCADCIDTYLKFLALFCTNVERLKVHTMKTSKMLIKRMKQLRELEIVKSSSVTGKGVHILSGLEKLSLVGCINLSPRHFRNICKNLKNLYYLDIRLCKNLTTQDYQHISEHLLQLKTLKFSCSNNVGFSCLSDLPNLKSLEIQRVQKYETYTVKFDTVIEEFLKSLSEFRGNQLEELKLIGISGMKFKIAPSVADLKKLKVLECNYKVLEDETLNIFSHLPELEDIYLTDCDFITDGTVLQILENCLKLEYIYLHNCISLTPDFFNSALKLIQEQHGNFLRTRCVHIEINPLTCICSNFVDDFSDMLKINCCPSFNAYGDNLYNSGDEFFDDNLDIDYEMF